MFSFFKFLQNSLKSLKQKKGLWFTTLAVLSISGIFISLYVLTHMTESSSKEVYKSISKTYTKNFKNRIYEKEKDFKQVLISVQQNTSLITAVDTNNLVEVGNLIGNYNKSFLDNGYTSLNLSFYPVLNQVNQYRNSINSVITSRNRVFGIEVLSDGVYFVLVDPIVVNDRLIGILELKEEISELKADYEKENSLFVFLLEDRMLSQLSINARTGKYREVVNNLEVEELKYDGQLYGKLIDNGEDDFKNMLQEGYSVDDQFFKVVQKVSDINGNIIGVIVLAETVDDSGAFVNIVDNMTKTVTTVALGLVISILLFMF